MAAKKTNIKNFGNYSKRITFSEFQHDFKMPNLIEIQLKSFDWFTNEGIKEVFDRTFPIISSDNRISITLNSWKFNKPEFDILKSRIKSKIYEKTTIANITLNATSDVIDLPIETKDYKTVITNYLIENTGITSLELKKAKGKNLFFVDSKKNARNEKNEFLITIEKETSQNILFTVNITRTSDVFLGKLPWMTEKGTFIVNGSEKVVVSQIVRSPGLYYKKNIDNKTGNLSYKFDSIPSRGTWLEFSADSIKNSKSKSNFNFSVRIDKSKKFNLTYLFTAFGLKKELILELFDNNKSLKTLYDLDEPIIQHDENKAIQEIYKKVKAGEIATAEGAKKIIFSILFDKNKYELTETGRHKFNYKLDLSKRALNKSIAQDIKDENNNIIIEEGTLITNDNINLLRDAINKGYLNRKINFNLEIESTNIINCLKVYSENHNEQDKKITLIGNDINYSETLLSIPDIIAGFSYLLNLIDEEIGYYDDIDNLGNRRINTVGNLIQNQYRLGMLRIEKNVKEKMATSNLFTMKPINIINSKPLNAIIGEFFNLSQLCQFMDQTNPLSELTNKRRVTALGPGGLSREHSGLEVRDVHFSHYGRLCPIETPEGPNIGLISNLSTYAKVDKLGFLSTPYQKVENGKLIKNEVHYLNAEQERDHIIGQGKIAYDESLNIMDENIPSRYNGKNIIAKKLEIDYIDIDAKQILSIATSCIPFLEKDDANRALMGANMQRQAMPLLRTEAPIVGTGIEHSAARDSGLALVSKEDGLVTYSDAKRIIVKDNKNKKHEYRLDNFLRSNQGTSLTHIPLVKTGDKIKANQIIADGPNINKGELALGQNLLVGFSTWNGYNYEDAIIISERLVKDDVFTSIHITEYKVERRKTKQGEEEITREIPNVSEKLLSNIGLDGVITVGSEVKAGDILVGKVTPKGHSKLSPEEKLLHAIFGEKSKNVKDSSLRVPNGGKGVVQSILRLNQEEHNLPYDVLEIIKIYVVQKRKIQEGDKLAGRHGNKGVISIVLPEEDMPFLSDGTRLDVLLNPLGVPSRMNIGQVLEMHLGLAGKKLNQKFANPVFYGATDEQIQSFMKKADLNPEGKEELYDGITGMKFEQKIAVGVMYMLKLSHMVEDKIHARNVGPYSLITQQPLGGKAQNGGQRFGEMEVWALEAYGAAHILREILTIKSDDIKGRSKTYQAIVKDKPIPEPGIPESFNVLIREIQGLGFNLDVINEKGEVEEKKSYTEEELVTIDNISNIDDNNQNIVTEEDLSSFGEIIENNLFSEDEE